MKMKKKVLLLLVSTIFFFLIITISGCEENILPTTNGIKVSVEPNPVNYDWEKGGWYFKVSIENLGSKKVTLIQANITGVVHISLFSFNLPEQVISSEELAKYFGTNIIEPYGKITWEKGYSYEEVEEAISSYEGIPGVSVNSFISGLELRIFVYGVTDTGVQVEGSTDIITFLPKP